MRNDYSHRATSVCDKRPGLSRPLPVLGGPEAGYTGIPRHRKNSASSKSLLSLLWFGLALMLCAPAAKSAGVGSDLLPPGFRPEPLGTHALTGARVIIKPGQAIENATIVIRDGRFAAVGSDIPVPPDARLWNLSDCTVYAGFIDACVPLGATNAPATERETTNSSESSFTARGLKFFGTTGARTDMGETGPGYRVSKVTPEFRAARHYVAAEKTLTAMRELGFTAGLIVPTKGIIRGTSALVQFADEDPNRTMLRPDVFQHVSFEPQRGTERQYPVSLMGAVAVIRQTFFDAQHYAREHSQEGAGSPAGARRPEFDPALEALGPAIQKKTHVMFETESALMVDRAARLARELGLEFCLLASGQEWRRADLARAVRATFVVPVNFPELPRTPDDEDWEQVRLDNLRAWDWAPENPAVLRQNGVDLALTTFGLSDKKKFRPNLRLALDRGLNESDALAALTTIPARLCGVDRHLGSIEPGKLANLTVVQGKSYFVPKSEVRAVWIEGRVYPLSPSAKPDRTVATESRPKPPGPEGDPTRKAEEEPEKQPKPPEIAAEKPEQSKPAESAVERPAESASDTNSIAKTERVREARKARTARSPLEGRGPLAEPRSVLLTGATIWTGAHDTPLENTDILVEKGRIKAVGRGLSVRSDYDGPPLAIDGKGLHVTAGLIDAHSHTAILGSVNESSLPSTAMVRIADVVNSETDNLYQQLAGGVTTVNLLHGSANPIGGQSCLIKLRDGSPPHELIFQDAPEGIKFALGENVKQSNAGDRLTTRFPQTRMGVQSFIANRFIAAKQYLDALEQATRDPSKLPPRRDLELEAIGQILRGERWIHSHAYRQDEILMLTRLMEGFGVKIGTFEHVLEGYKVADELSAHDAGASTFSDWWAYKFEVYDAIPHNGTLMHNRGVLVSFNSDSSEMARRLYSEAAKAVKYGGMPETEALKLVTLNPAKQLRIDKRVGSLEPGKDADFVLWSKSPLDATTVCLQTWIDGKKFFDRTEAHERAKRLEDERAELLAKARAVKLGGGHDDAGDDADDSESFFRAALEKEHQGYRGCLDEASHH